MSKVTLGFFALGAAVAGALAWACTNTVPSPCATYCVDVQTACTGDDQQYADQATCQTICAQWGPGEAGVATGDTVACREVAVSNTKDETSATAKHAECVGAGIAAGQCTGNDPCQAFCAVDMALCAGMNDFGSIQDCLTACKTWGQTFQGPILDSTGNTLQCRVYHLELSQTGEPADLATHCPHTGACSARCKDDPNAATSCDDAGAGDAGLDGAADATGD